MGQLGQNMGGFPPPNQEKFNIGPRGSFQGDGHGGSGGGRPLSGGGVAVDAPGGAVQRGDASSSAQGSVQSGSVANRQAQASPASSEGARTTEQIDVVVKLCYKCDQVGHVIKDCKILLFCDVCGKDSHLTSKCVLPMQPKATAQLVGSAADGLQMFVSVWVKLSGIPDSLMHYQGFCMAGSISGTMQEVDMVSFRKHDVVRVRVGVMDHLRIPDWGPLTIDPFIYRIYFQLESVVEIGVPLIGGVVVKVNPMQIKHATEHDGVGGKKRFKDNQGSKHDTDPAHEINDEEMAASSQPNMADLALSDGRNGRNDLQLTRADISDKVSAISQVNLSFAKETEQLDNLECSDDESDPKSPTQFARDCGLGTQAINEMNNMDYNVDSPESDNLVPIGTPPAQNENVGTPKNYADAVRNGQNSQGKSPVPIKDGKTKKGTIIDDGNRRRSNRNTNDDKATLDRQSIWQD